MWMAVRRLWLAVVVLVAASAVLLYTDVSGRHAERGDDPRRVPRVALLQHVSNAILDEIVEGMVAELAAEGFVRDQTLDLQIYNPAGDVSLAASTAQRMVNGGYDLLLTVSTPSLQALAKANQNTRRPHVFAGVTDPWGAGVGLSAGPPASQPAWLTGVGTLQPVGQAFRMARTLNPGLRRVGIAWNPAEYNSEVNTKSARAACAELGIELVERSVENSSGVPDAARSLVASGVQAIFVGGDVAVLTALDSVVTAARSGRIPVFTCTPQDVRRGALFSVGADYLEVGQRGAALGVQILRGTAAGQIPVEKFVPEMLALNTTAVASLREPWTVTPEVLAQAKLVVSDAGVTDRRVRRATQPATAPASQAARRQGPWNLAVIRYADSKPSLDANTGLHDGLAAAGLVRGRDYVAREYTAGQDAGTLRSIVDTVRSQRPDLVITVGTPALQAVLNRFPDTPVIFTVSAAPVQAGAGRSNEDHRPNVTGIITLGDYAQMAEVVRRCLPRAKRFGTLYTPAETNSAYARDVLAAEFAKVGLELVAVAADSSAELPDAARALCGKDLDALCQLSDNLTSATFGPIVKAAESARLPVFSFQSDQPAAGGVLALARDYHDAGVETGALVAKVLRGANPATIPFRPMSTSRLIINLKQAEKHGVHIPADLLAKADQVIR